MTVTSPKAQFTDIFETGGESVAGFPGLGCPRDPFHQDIYENYAFA